MSRENAEIVRDQFEAVNERDFARAMNHYASDVELVVPDDLFLEGGTFKGREAVGQWFGDWFRTFQHGYRFELEEVRDLGDAVLVVASHHGQGRTSGVEVHSRSNYLYRLRSQKVVHVEFFPTRAEAVEAAGSLADS